MSIWFSILTIVFILVSAAMILIILVQRPQGGGLAGAFGGAGGTGADTVFGGRVGDALTWMTVVAFVVYLGLAVGLNLMDTSSTSPAAQPQPTSITTPIDDAEEDAGLVPPGGSLPESSDR
jgi:preprotein translocase subunit SecG